MAEDCGVKEAEEAERELQTILVVAVANWWQAYECAGEVDAASAQGRIVHPCRCWEFAEEIV